MEWIKQYGSGPNGSFIISFPEKNLPEPFEYVKPYRSGQPNIGLCNHYYLKNKLGGGFASVFTPRWSSPNWYIWKWDSTVMFGPFKTRELAQLLAEMMYE